MVCTKAIIKALPEEGSNIFKVEVPLFEDNTRTEAIFDALLCTDPSMYNGYAVGDCVFVEFEDEYYNTAIIMGKLYTGTADASSSYGIMNELNVTDKVTLPENTEINGVNLTKALNNINNSVSGNVTTKKVRFW